MLLIGIAGKAHSGKDTLANLLITRLLLNWRIKATRLSFATKLKEAVCLLYGFDPERIKNDTEYKEGFADEIPEFNMTRREIMQRFGTEGMRGVMHENHWIWVLGSAVKRGEYKDYEVGIISDCRFINELEWAAASGLTVQIQRDGGATTVHSEHASETEWQQWQNWDHIIKNVVVPDSVPASMHALYQSSVPLLQSIVTKLRS